MKNEDIDPIEIYQKKCKILLFVLLLNFIFLIISIIYFY